MFPQNTWCFDLEIVNAILGKGEQQQPGIRYCNGWNDHAGMGVSVLVIARPDGADRRAFIGCDKAWGSEALESLEFTVTHLSEFQRYAAEADLLIGHNSRSFDAKVLAAKGIFIDERKHLDFYHEIKRSTRQPFPKGYNLNVLSQRCGGPAKSDDGAMAPLLWQQGHYKRVIEYCINDIVMTCAVAGYYAENTGKLPSPEPNYRVQLRLPEQLASGG